ncbi:MAG: YdcF family protein [Pseudomonadota bacterium]
MPDAETPAFVGSGSEKTPYDAIVVLGAAVWPNGQPSPTLERRALEAASQYHAGSAPVIIGSGGTGEHPPSEAEMIARLCVENGVPVDCVLEEAQSTTTMENALYSGQILRLQNATKILVVTDSYHLPRALMCFRSLGFAADGAAPDRRYSAIPIRKLAWQWLREAIALPFYFVRLRILNRPQQLS